MHRFDAANSHPRAVPFLLSVPRGKRARAHACVRVHICDLRLRVGAVLPGLLRVHTPSPVEQEKATTFKSTRATKWAADDKLEASEIAVATVKATPGATPAALAKANAELAETKAASLVASCEMDNAVNALSVNTAAVATLRDCSKANVDAAARHRGASVAAAMVAVGLALAGVFGA